jgi:sulfite reductase alpha subunit
MADSGNGKTPLLDELEKGPWPSFVKQIKSMAGKKPTCRALLQQL